MSRIKSLTPKQEARMPEFVEKWLKIGLSTHPANHEIAEKWIQEAYVEGKETYPGTIWVGSPMGCVYAGALQGVERGVWQGVGHGVGHGVLESVRQGVRHGVLESVWQGVGHGVLESVRQGVRHGVLESVWQGVWQGVEQGVEQGVRQGVRHGVRHGVRQGVLESVWRGVWDNFCFGLHESTWLSFYDFFLEVCGLSICKPLYPMMKLAENCGWWLPYREIVIASEKPSFLKQASVNGNPRLHCDGGPAIAYPDGYAMWFLNGVPVSREIAETPADKLDSKLVLSEKNAEVRREIVRKIGVDRVLTTLGGKELETWGNYSLISMDLGDGRHRPYLKMLNPSVGTWHVEGVHPDCRTIEEALNWRNRTKETPVVLTYPAWPAFAPASVCGG